MLAAIAAGTNAQMGYFGSDGDVEMDVNVTPVRNLYPGAGGGTLATLGAAGSPDNLQRASLGAATGEGPAVQTPTGGAGGLSWWVGIAIVLGLLMFTAKKTGQASDFSNLRISTYNVLFITLTAVLGLTALKIVAVKVKDVPPLKGFSQVVIAA